MTDMDFIILATIFLAFVLIALAVAPYVGG